VPNPAPLKNDRFFLRGDSGDAQISTSAR
jgi:hypothetical protein